ncbi:MAG: hypothetical protein LBG60_12655 [Bifidobacteriaceae bacterium]|jgi:hypothetical protein|nr:hypothetical protein [Bifidobacteriaceae bacterium]
MSTAVEAKGESRRRGGPRRVRATADLPPATYELVKGIARREGRSVSSTLERLIRQALAGEATDLELDLELERDQATGLLRVPSRGRKLTEAEIAQLLDDDE